MNKFSDPKLDDSIFLSKGVWQGLEHNRWLKNKRHFPERLLESTPGPYIPFPSKMRVSGPKTYECEH